MITNEMIFLGIFIIVVVLYFCKQNNVEGFIEGAQSNTPWPLNIEDTDVDGSPNTDENEAKELVYRGDYCAAKGLNYIDSENFTGGGAGGCAKKIKPILLSPYKIIYTDVWGGYDAEFLPNKVWVRLPLKDERTDVWYLAVNGKLEARDRDSNDLAPAHGSNISRDVVKGKILSSIGLNGEITTLKHNNFEEWLSDYNPVFKKSIYGKTTQGRATPGHPTPDNAPKRYNDKGVKRKAELGTIALQPQEAADAKKVIIPYNVEMMTGTNVNIMKNKWDTGGTKGTGLVGVNMKLITEDMFGGTAKKAAVKAQAAVTGKAAVKAQDAVAATGITITKPTKNNKWRLTIKPANNKRIQYKKVASSSDLIFFDLIEWHPKTQEFIGSTNTTSTPKLTPIDARDIGPIGKFTLVGDAVKQKLDDYIKKTYNQDGVNYLNEVNNLILLAAAISNRNTNTKIIKTLIAKLRSTNGADMLVRIGALKTTLTNYKDSKVAGKIMDTNMKLAIGAKISALDKIIIDQTKINKGAEIAKIIPNEKNVTLNTATTIGSAGMKSASVIWINDASNYAKSLFFYDKFVTLKGQVITVAKAVDAAALSVKNTDAAKLTAAGTVALTVLALKDNLFGKKGTKTFITAVKAGLTTPEQKAGLDYMIPARSSWEDVILNSDVNKTISEPKGAKLKTSDKIKIYDSLISTLNSRITIHITGATGPVKKLPQWTIYASKIRLAISRLKELKAKERSGQGTQQRFVTSRNKLITKIDGDIATLKGSKITLDPYKGGKFIILGNPGTDKTTWGKIKPTSPSIDKFKVGNIIFDSDGVAHKITKVETTTKEVIMKNVTSATKPPFTGPVSAGDSKKIVALQSKKEKARDTSDIIEEDKCKTMTADNIIKESISKSKYKGGQLEAIKKLFSVVLEISNTGTGVKGKTSAVTTVIKKYLNVPVEGADNDNVFSINVKNIPNLLEYSPLLSNLISSELHDDKKIYSSCLTYTIFDEGTGGGNTAKKEVKDNVEKVKKQILEYRDITNTITKEMGLIHPLYEKSSDLLRVLNNPKGMKTYISKEMKDIGLDKNPLFKTFNDNYDVYNKTQRSQDYAKFQTNKAATASTAAAAASAAAAAAAKTITYTKKGNTIEIKPKVLKPGAYKGKYYVVNYSGKSTVKSSIATPSGAGLTTDKKALLLSGWIKVVNNTPGAKHTFTGGTGTIYGPFKSEALALKFKK